MGAQPKDYTHFTDRLPRVPRPKYNMVFLSIDKM